MFTEKVKEHFRYLIDDYGFSIVNESYTTDSGNGLVEFRSRSVHIRIVLDRGQVLIDIGPSPEVLDYWFDLSSVIEFLSPEAHEPAYIFPEKWDNYYEMIDWQVARLARVLRQYCVSVLTREFPDWRELLERNQKEAEEVYKTLTGKASIKGSLKEFHEEIQRRRKK